MKTIFVVVVLPIIFFAPSAPASSWQTNSPMASARQFHTATLLTNGLVLVAGGEDASFTVTASAEIYIPSTGTWTNTGSMHEARQLFTATLLNNGMVLVAGGLNAGGALATAELYNPATGLWSLTGSMTNARCAHTATLLTNGKVLVSGGESGGVLAMAEIYDVAQGSWSPVKPMLVARGYHTATLLPGDRVLVAGGRDDSFNTIQSVEVYDVSTNGWTVAGEMNFPRRSHTATLLPWNGKVLVLGGRQLGAELYNPVSGDWTWTLVNGITNALYGQTATLLPNGSVLVASGIDLASSFDTITNAWIYDPRADSWSVTADLNQGRYVHTATALPNGCVLAVGGGSFMPPFRLATAECFVPVDPITLTATSLPNGQFQIAFTNTPGFTFAALASTNLTLTTAGWTELGLATETSPGQFQFTDPQATNSPQRFYRVRAN
jgi:hypothetical protein